jgi:uncharacterized protein YbaR (Trm112 family)
MSAPTSLDRNALHRVEAVLDLLVCPECRSRLVLDVGAGELVCSGADCGLAYPVTADGVPVLLIDEARRPEPPAPPEPPATPEEPEPAGDGSTVR